MPGALADQETVPEGAVEESPATVALHLVDVPTTGEVFAHVTVTVLGLAVGELTLDMMFRFAAPLLSRLNASPPYSAVILTVPDVAAVMVTEQDPADSVHEALEPVNTTEPDPDSAHETVPVGELPFTVAVQVTTIVEPAITGDGLQVTEAVEALSAVVTVVEKVVVLVKA